MDSAVTQSDARPEAPAAWPVVWVALLLLAAGGTVLAGMVHGANGFIPTLAFLICLLAAWFDAGTGRVPNALTYTAIAVGLGLNLVGAMMSQRFALHTPGWLGAVAMSDCLLGFGIYAAAGILALMMAGLGGGDMKLLVALGSLLGLQGASPVVLLGLCLAVVYAMCNVILRGRVNATMQTFSLAILTIVFLRQRADVPALSAKKIPLALPLALGMIASRLLPLEVWHV